MRKNSKSSRSRFRAHVELETLEQRQLLSSAVMGAMKFTVAPRPGAAASANSGVASPTYVLAGPDVGTGTDVPTGLTPQQVRAAYGMNQISFNGIAGDGTGQTIAIIDAFDDPAIQQDLQAFDATFGLPAGQLTVVNQDGGSALPGVDPAGQGNINFESEEALDVEWAHVMAPGARLILVEANDSSLVNLFGAANWARNQPGVSVVTMSFGGGETPGLSVNDATFTTPANHEGVTFLASTGDAGEPGGYPAYSPNVVAVGGTTAVIDSLGNLVSETGWSGSGGGISQFESKPGYQVDVTQSPTRRTIPDVSFVADPLTGVPIYDSYNNGTDFPWLTIGGTSLASPAWAGIIAVADEGRAIAGVGTLDGVTQTLPMLYGAPAGNFHDITTGNNGFAAGPGYDLVTGLGTPVANDLVPYLVTGITTPPSNGPTVTSIVPSSTTVTAGSPLTLTALGVGDPGATGVTVTFYEESNGTQGLQIGAGGDTAFTAQTNGSNSLTIDTTGLSGVLTFYVQVTDSSGAATDTGFNAPSVAVNVVAAGIAGPTIGAITATPNPVVAGNELTLQASGFTDPNGSVRRVTFYQETNGVAGLQTGVDGDLALPQVSASSNYTLQVDTVQLTGVQTFYALAVDSNGNTSAEDTFAPSVVVSVASSGVPTAPISLTATPVSTTSVALTFNEVNSNQVGFKIERATEPSFTVFTTLFTIDRPLIKSYTDVGLSAGTRYFYRVIAFNLSGDSAPSNTADATTLFTPAQLGFGQQPLTQPAGGILRDIVVNVETPSGGVSTIDNSNVTLTIASGPAGATIGGTTTVQAINGVATFSGLTLTKAGTYTLLATDSDLGTGKSVTFTVSPQAASAHLVLEQQPTTPLVGVKGVPAYVVDLDDQFGNLVTTAKSKVTVSVASGPSFVPGGTKTVALKKGVGTLSNVILPAAGNYVLHLTDSAFGTTAVVSQAVAMATTTIATPKTTTAKAGKNVNLTAQLKSNAPKKVPFAGFASIGIDEGNGVFDILSTGTVNAKGVLKFNLASIPAGTYANVQVAYTGDTSHTAARSGTFTLVVNPGVQQND